MACTAAIILVLAAPADAQSSPPASEPATTSTTKPASPEAPAPGAPTITEVTAGNQKAQVTWKVSNENGATAAAKYEVTPYRGTTAQPSVTVDAPATTATVTGLHNNATYTFKVLAVDAEGHKSKESLPSAAVTPKASASSAWYKSKRYWAIAFVVLAAVIGLGAFLFVRKSKKTTESPDGVFDGSGTSA